MRHFEDRFGMHVDIETKECPLPEGVLTGLQPALDQLGAGVEGLPASLHVTVVYHPQTDRYHCEAALALPRRGLYTGEWDADFDTAVHRSLRKMQQKLAGYLREPDRRGDEIARQVREMNEDVVAPEDPDEGAVGKAVEAADYEEFRRLAAPYEDWLSLRVGRWVQRHPEIEDELGDRLTIRDIVEEVFLNAFEHHAERPAVATFHDWLEEWIEPSMQGLKKDFAGELDNISQARTLHETHAT